MITDENNEEYLAVSTGFKSKIFKGINTAEIRSSAGFIIDGCKLVEWKIKGFREIDGIIYFFGPSVHGRLLSETELDTRVILKLIHAFNLLEKSGYSTKQFNLSSVLLTDDDKVLFFPPLLFDFINSASAETEKLDTIYPWNHPDYTGDKAAAFTLAAVAYRALTGIRAFRGKERAELNRAMVKRQYSSPLVKQPALKKEIVSLIENSFSGNTTLEDWTGLEEIFESNELFDKTLSPSDIKLIKARSGSIEKRRIRRVNASNFISSNRTKLIIIAAVIIILLSILSSVISNLTAPTVTAGMQQIDVVKLYYQSLDSMEIESMEDCVTRKAGKRDVDQLITTTALVRTRSAYENNLKIIDVQSWKADEMPQLDMQTLLWGLDNVKIEKLAALDSYSVSYEKWLPGGFSTEDNVYRPDAFEITDVVHLSVFRETWIIDMIERSSLYISEYRSND